MSKIPIDTSKKAPSYNAYSIQTSKFWEPNVDNNRLIAMTQRNGIASKIVKKLKIEMTKFLFTLDDEIADDLRFEYNMDKIAAYAWECAYVSGYSLIYVGYKDINTQQDYLQPPNSKEVDYFYVIPRAWIAQDYKVNGSNIDYDYYEIFTDGGNTIKIHKDRFIRVAINEQERSSFESCFNALDVVDNILWSSGQAMFRAGQGFPTLTVTNPEAIDDGNGGVKNELEVLKESGVMRDINSMTGFIGSDRHKFEFIGANGKALNPTEYWGVAIEAVAASVDLPKDIIIGVSAGAVTGSEVNTKELASNVAYRQQSELEPIYDAMFERLNLNPFDIEYVWLSTYVQSQKEQAETFEIEVRAFSSGVISGLFDSKTAQNILISRHDWLKINPNVEELPMPNEEKPVENKEEIVIKKQPNDLYKIDDRKIADSLIDALSEGSTMPPSIQKTEINLMKDMVSQYSKTQKNVETIFTAFNTDEVSKKKSYRVRQLTNNELEIIEDEI